MTPIRGPLARLDRSRDELAKAWLVRLIERASLDEISELPTEQIARELPDLISDIVERVASTNGDPRSRLTRRQRAYPMRSDRACVVPMMPIHASGAPITRT